MHGCTWPPAQSAHFPAIASSARVDRCDMNSRSRSHCPWEAAWTPPTSRERPFGRIYRLPTRFHAEARGFGAGPGAQERRSTITPRTWAVASFKASQRSKGLPARGSLYAAAIESRAIVQDLHLQCHYAAANMEFRRTRRTRRKISSNARESLGRRVFAKIHIHSRGADQIIVFPVDSRAYVNFHEESHIPFLHIRPVSPTPNNQCMKKRRALCRDLPKWLDRALVANLLRVVG